MGEVVIVREEGLPLSFWKLGCIQDLIVGKDGKDGKTRGATVEVTIKSRRFTFLNRPLQQLYPLVINHSPELMDTPQETRESEKQDKYVDQSLRQPRPQRAAAAKGEEKQRQWTCGLQG